MVWPLPGDCKGRDRTRARSTDSMHLRVFRNVVLLVEHRHQFFGDHSRVLVIESVVLGGSIACPISPLLRSRLGLLRSASGIDEDTNHHRYLAAIDQIVHNVLRSNITILVLEGVAILKDHERCWNCCIVLRRNVYPVCMLSSGVDIAREREWPANLTLWDTFLRKRVRPESILRIRIRTGRQGLLCNSS